MSLDDRLHHHLQEASNIHPGPPDPQRAAGRHRQRQLRRRGAFGVVMMAAAVGFGAMTLNSSQQNDVEAAGPNGQDDTGGPTTAPDVSEGTDSAVVSAEIDWQSVPASLTPIGTKYYRGEDLFYALSTAPGAELKDYPDGRVPRSIYESADGVAWTERTRFDDPWISDLGIRDGELFYAIGTAPSGGSSDDVEALFATSDDGGLTWSQTILPSSVVDLDPALPIVGDFVQLRLATIGDTAVVALTIRRPIDYRALVPDAFRPDGEDWYASPTANGLAIYDMSEAIEIEMACAAGKSDICEPTSQEGFIEAVVPWEQLPAAAQTNPAAVNFYVVDGVGAPVPVPGPFDGQLLSLYSGENGALAVTFVEPASEGLLR